MKIYKRTIAMVDKNMDYAKSKKVARKQKRNINIGLKSKIKQIINKKKLKEKTEIWKLTEQTPSYLYV